MKHETERLLSLGAAVVCLLCGAYIGHVNTLDELRAGHGDSCVAVTDSDADR